MHNTFYASGFLYHAPTQQILLHHPDPATLTLFTGKNYRGESPEAVFKRIIAETIHRSLPRQAIQQIYDYTEETTLHHYVILFAEVPTLTLGTEVLTASWFLLKQLTKLPLSPQARQDIIVGQRVINALARDKEVIEQLEKPG